MCRTGPCSSKAFLIKAENFCPLVYYMDMMIVRMLFAGALVLCALHAQTAAVGQSEPQHQSWTLYNTSVAALIAANSVDAASSWGQREANPLLGERFGGRSAAIKFGGTAGALAAQYFVLRRHPGARRRAALVNFAVSGALSAVAIHNYTIGR